MRAYAQGTPKNAEARGADLFKKSVEAYRRGDFTKAIELLKQAYALDPQPVLLYNLARAYEGLGDIDAALTTYARYLEADPKAADRGAIERRMATLAREMDERLALERQRDEEKKRAEEAARAAENERRQRAEEKPPPPPPQEPHKRSPFPYVVAGVGLAGVGTGIALGLAATSRHDRATSDASLQDALDDQSSAKHLATFSTVAFVAGAALVAAGVTWWVLDAKGSGATQVGLGPGFVRLARTFP